MSDRIRAIGAIREPIISEWFHRTAIIRKQNKREENA